MTKNEIMKDLKEIRYYYSRKDAIREITGEITADVILEKVNKYNMVVRKAPIRLYDVYINLYVDNNTQESLAYKWGYTVQTIRNLNNKLCDFLISNL